MPEMSKLATGLKRSGIRVIMELAMGMKDVVRLEVGEPLFATPDHIVEAAAQAGRDGYTKYTPNAGIPSLREAIARRLEGDYGVKVTPSNVAVTVGGVGAVSTAVRTLIDIGDEVLIPDPGWPNYEMIVSVAGAVPVRYRLDPARGFLPLAQDLNKVVTPKTKAIILNSPSNPLGTVFPPEVMEEMVDFARKRDLFIISDEVYEKIVFYGKHTSALSFDTDGRVVGAFSVAKTYAMTGWRIGYAVAAPAVTEQMAKLQEAYVSCAPGVSQKAAESAIRGPQDCVETMRRAYHENLLVARQILDRHGIKYQTPSGAFYLWIDAGCQDSTDFAKKLLLEKQVSLAPGRTFGPSGDRYVRISLASPKESIQEGLIRLAQFLGK